MNLPLKKSELFATLPPVPEGAEELPSLIQELLQRRPGHKLVVLDDDPTGTQTVYDVPVRTTWEAVDLREEFAQQGGCFYVLTNSRSLTAEDAQEQIAYLAQQLQKAASANNFTVISRSDSTLRGHFPLETDTLNAILGPYKALFIIPYFEDGGRYTVNDIHYVAEGEMLIPAAQTPFARDAVFGYRSSNLREWVEEKTGGRIRRDSVLSLSLSELRRAEYLPEAIQRLAQKLLSLPTGAVVIVNACAPSDLWMLAAATLHAEQAGARFLYRTAAQFVAARLGLLPRPLLRGHDLIEEPSPAGGLVVVGSHVPKSTAQLNHLLEQPGWFPMELSVPRLCGLEATAVIDTAVRELNHRLASGQNVVLFTSRQLLTGATPEETLRIGQRVSAALVEIVSHLAVQPRFLIAKGGITSSDLATRALNVRRALVRGQLLPGVPVWQLGSESRLPGLNYIVFPGNVGGPEALTQAVAALTTNSSH